MSRNGSGDFWMTIPDFPNRVAGRKRKNRQSIRNWLRNRNTIEFLGIWERLNNPDFKPVEFDGFRKQAGLNSFTLTPKQWIENTGAIGIISKAGRYGGTYAHKDIAFEFASWISVEFKLYLIKEFQRLKDTELKQFGWDIKRNLAKINYRIHTDAIQENLIPRQVTKIQINNIYASEADILNVALFGITAKEWRENNRGKKVVSEIMLMSPNWYVSPTWKTRSEERRVGKECRSRWSPYH